jgi:phospholipid/cholesterol/gamma-HCH transport system permease protein
LALTPAPVSFDVGSSAAREDPPTWEVRRSGDHIATLVLRGNWRRGSRIPFAETVAAIRRDIADATHLQFDAGGLVSWNSFLISMLWHIRQPGGSNSSARPVNLAFDDAGLPASARRLLLLVGNNPRPPASPIRLRDPFVIIGAGAMALLAQIGAIAQLLVGVSAAVVPRWGRTHFQWPDLRELVRSTGPSALPIIGLVNLLVGAIIAFIGAAQLRRFGAQIYISNLVGVSVVRELAVVITAIVLAGRTGGAYAARIATMQSNEEIDALVVLGVNVRRYLVLPMVLSLALMTPLLYVYGCAAGLLGGMMVAASTLDVSPFVFAIELTQAVSLVQLVFAAFKAVIFALVIGLVSCNVGLRAERSAAAVGRAATEAVVASIVCVIAADSLFAVCATALGF